MRRLAVLLPVLLVPAAAAAEPWDGATRWGVGLHASALGLEPAAESGAAAEDRFELGGGGIQLRYRMSRLFELELAAHRVAGEDGAGARVRDLRLATLGLAVHLTPGSRWSWLVSAGLGGGREEVTVRAGKEQAAAFAHGHAYLGLGLERRFRRFAVAGELRAVSLRRSPEDLDGPAFAGRDHPVPEESAGGQLRIAASYFF